MIEQQWYYWHESEVLGPFSSQQLVDLATAGSILPDDIVWKDGVEGGVPAQNVQHLFTPTAPVSAEPAIVAKDNGEAKPAETTPKVDAPAKSGWDRGSAGSTGKARAVAGKGTVIVGQDGKNVKFRMKCTVCNHEDSSWQTMTITRGTTRKVYYCPKCRKRCSVEITGYVS